MKKFNQNNATIQHCMECYKVIGEPDDDDPLDVNILEYEGTSGVEGLIIFSNQFLNLIKIKKFNIDSLQNPKFTNIEYYWDDDTVGKIPDLLYKFHDLLPTKFLEMKGIIGDLGEMKIPLRLDAKSFNK